MPRQMRRQKMRRRKHGLDAGGTFAWGPIDFITGRVSRPRRTVRLARRAGLSAWIGSVGRLALSAWHGATTLAINRLSLLADLRWMWIGAQASGEGRRWIGVDLDGTLAEYHHWMGIEHIGEPVPAMLERVKGWLAEGVEVRIFTARVCRPAHRGAAIRRIGDWCEMHGLPRLPVTNVKDYGMIELWDDRAVRVETNIGRRADGQTTGRRRRRGKGCAMCGRQPEAEQSGQQVPGAQPAAPSPSGQPRRQTAKRPDGRSGSGKPAGEAWHPAAQP
jgi:hypothetical protein